ncbi:MULTISPECIES: hypothetical protein [Pseudomonas]|uniref:hypothetical protein n=1 Tax=Pseudomonas TaxID=286 RepID=UPI0018E6CFDE|nr:MULTISPECIES: hypothetical protein [Pseudomonas]MBI6921100.1 hypothetical protein [Pseudomonas monteilii]MCE0936297.1 hypothetical protein [Pseudomonas kurunegalensis]
MKLINTIAIGSMLLGLAGAVHAEDGSMRAQQFKQNFLAEQARLWGNDAAAQKQQIAQVQARQIQQRVEAQTAVRKGF